MTAFTGTTQMATTPIALQFEKELPTASGLFISDTGLYTLICRDEIEWLALTANDAASIDARLPSVLNQLVGVLGFGGNHLVDIIRTTLLCWTREPRPLLNLLTRHYLVLDVLRVNHIDVDEASVDLDVLVVERIILSPSLYYVHSGNRRRMGIPFAWLDNWYPGSCQKLSAGQAIGLSREELAVHAFSEDSATLLSVTLPMLMLPD